MTDRVQRRLKAIAAVIKSAELSRFDRDDFKHILLGLGLTNRETILTWLQASLELGLLREIPGPKGAIRVFERGRRFDEYARPETGSQEAT